MHIHRTDCYLALCMLEPIYITFLPRLAILKLIILYLRPHCGESNRNEMKLSPTRMRRTALFKNVNRASQEQLNAKHSNWLSNKKQSVERENRRNKCFDSENDEVERPHEQGKERPSIHLTWRRSPSVTSAVDGFGEGSPSNPGTERLMDTVPTGPVDESTMQQTLHLDVRCTPKRA